MWHAGSWFPSQGLEPTPLQKYGVLAADCQGSPSQHSTPKGSGQDLEVCGLARPLSLTQS